MHTPYHSDDMFWRGFFNSTFCLLDGVRGFRVEIEGMGELRLRGSLTLAQAGGGIGIECICCGAVVVFIAS